MRVVRHRELAEDVLQECFIAVWRTAGNFQRSASPPSAWLAMIVKGRAPDVLRKQAARRTLMTEESDELGAEGFDTNSADPMDAVADREQVVELHKSLSRLPVKQCGFLCSAFLQDLTHVEIARQQDLPLGTVKSSIRHGLAKLRLDMDDSRLIPSGGRARGLHFDYVCRGVRRF